MLDLNSLPQEVRDRLTMKEESDQFFSNSLEIDYTDIMLNTLDDRRKKGAQQNYLASLFGQQGCVSHDTKILVFRDCFLNIPISDLCQRTDRITAFNGKSLVLSSFRKVHTGIKKCFLVTTGSGRTLIASGNHDMLVWNGLDIEKCPLLKLDSNAPLVVLGNGDMGVGVDELRAVKPVGLFDVYDLQVPNHHNFMLSNGLMVGNSGKSYAGLFICGYLDQDFSVENIFFDYNKLVNERYKLKPHTAVLVDEQMGLYGVDSVRVSIILNALKEQMRKRSVHMCYASPTLKEEFHTSNYVLETMFVDKIEKELYASYKTNELKCLGYVVIPHPLNVISKKLLLEYEKLKDEHLDRLISQPIDDVEERAKVIVKDKYFIAAEKVYLDKIGYIPYRTLVQIVNKMFPEFKGSVIVFEVCDRIRLGKELGDFPPSWEISGKSWQKKKMEGEERRDAKKLPDDVSKGGIIDDSDSEISHLKFVKKKFEPKLKSSQLDMIKQKFTGGGTRLPTKKQRTIRR